MPRLLSDQQKAAIEAAVRDNHLAFLGETFGPSAISRDDYQRLKRAGKIRGGHEAKIDAATRAHVLGVLSGEAQDVKLEREVTTRGLLQASAERQDTMTPEERDAVQVARERIALHVKGLGDNLKKKVARATSDAETRVQRKRQVVRDKVAAGVIERKESARIAKELRDALPGVEADFLRLAHTEVHNLIDEARAAAILREEPDANPLVYKRPRPDACAICKKLYLKADGTPRIFKLSRLMSNGTNVGLRAAEWQAVIGSTHPWCACELHRVPAGYGFNDGGALVRKSAVKIDDIDPELLRHECE